MHVHWSGLLAFAFVGKLQVDPWVGDSTKYRHQEGVDKEHPEMAVEAIRSEAC